MEHGRIGHDRILTPILRTTPAESLTDGEVLHDLETRPEVKIIRKIDDATDADK